MPCLVGTSVAMRHKYYLSRTRECVRVEDGRRTNQVIFKRGENEAGENFISHKRNCSTQEKEEMPLPCCGKKEQNLRTNFFEERKNDARA